ncbi:MAG: tetratricopeptide repeat-containing sulfotransferase family protein [Pseudomonadales bacterium]
MAEQHPRKVFERAINLLRGGARGEAEALCRDRLVQDPGDINFVALLGTILADKHEFEEAAELLGRAVKAAPGHGKAHEDLGTVLLNLNRAAEALPHLERARSLQPENPSLLNKLGGAFQRLGRSEEAAQCLEAAAQLSPYQAKLEEATRKFASGRFREAETMAQALVRENPRDVNAALLLARIAINANCFDDAKELLERITQTAPRFVAAWHDLGTVLKELHQYDEAVAALRRALAMDPKNALTHYYHGAALAMAARPEEAVAAYEQAVALDPDLTGAHIGLGHVLKTVGDHEGGVAAYRRAIELRPNFGETYYSLANLKTFRFSGAEIEDMKRRLESEKLPVDCKVHFAFALGKAFEDQKDFDASFHYYALANQSHRDTIAYDPVQTEIAHERMREVFTKTYFDKVKSASLGCADGDPIFIVGLPRSGSTLLEQILASHSMVDGTSELPDISMIAQGLARPRSGQAFPQCLLDLPEGRLAELGAQYLDQTRRHRGGAPFFTDKMPNNFAYVGFIKAILPNAKIIDARRHPMDSCFGCFKQHFAKGQTFTYDLFELGEFYLEYEQIMRHWDEALPGEVLHVQYESVVDNLEVEVRHILEFCGLPFEPECVSFHETKRAVRTASSEQVRQPIYRGAMQTWKRYGSNLDGLREILNPVLPLADRIEAS